MIKHKIKAFIQTLDKAVVSNERKLVLLPLVNIIQSKFDTEETIQLQFICTHNSRRSHFAQIWAQTLAEYFKIPNIHCFSAGTEATALFPVVIDTLIQTGFEIHKLSDGNNPEYNIAYAEDHEAIIGFSKTLDSKHNPKSDFIAIMTCNHADQNCPIVIGATHRISIPFDDPKLFDNTPLQVEKYAERSFQIASELYYVYSQIKLQ